MSLPASWFDVYSLVGDETVRIGFNATFLHRILSSRDKDQQIQLVFSFEDSDRLMIHLTKPGEPTLGSEVAVPSQKKEKKTAATTNTFDKHFELPLIDIDEEGLQIPEIEYTAELAMQSSQFADIVTQLKMFGDTMEVQCSE
jgi:hypothetical protein